MSQIQSFNPIDTAVRSPSTSRFNEMATEDFIRIIFTELSNQDPFEPSDSSALLDQLNSIRSIESDIELGNRLKDLVFENQFSAAANMVGKFIGGLTADNDRVAGFVVSVIRQGEDIVLELDNGWQVPIQGVETIVDQTLLPEELVNGTPPPEDTPEDTPDDTPEDTPEDTP